MHRSYSQLDQVRRCGEAYRLARVERVPKRPSWAQVAGVVIHSASESIDHAIHDLFPSGGWHSDFTDYELPAIGNDRVAEVWDATLDEFSENYKVEDWKVFGKQDQVWWWETGIPSALTAYINWRADKRGWRLAEIPNFGVAIEVPFELQLPSVKLTGYIDRIFTVEGYDGDYFPVDIKSGKKPETNEQLALYARALHEALGWPISYGFYVYELKTGTAKQTKALNLSHWTLEQLDSVYGNADKIIEQGLFLPKPGDSCFVCDVSESCDFQQASI